MFYWRDPHVSEPELPRGQLTWSTGPAGPSGQRPNAWGPRPRWRHVGRVAGAAPATQSTVARGGAARKGARGHHLPRGWLHSDESSPASRTVVLDSPGLAGNGTGDEGWQRRGSGGDGKGATACYSSGERARRSRRSSGARAR